MRIKLKQGATNRHRRLSGAKEYVVVGWDDEYYRIVNDGGEPILYPKSDFDVVDAQVPKGWTREDYEDGEYHVGPPETSGVGFYEDYFDGDETAKGIFEKVYRELIRAEAKR